MEIKTLNQEAWSSEEPVSSSFASFHVLEVYGNHLALSGLKVFFFLVCSAILTNFKILFLSTHGWSHRLAGGTLLLWLILGTSQIILGDGYSYFYDYWKNDKSSNTPQELQQNESSAESESLFWYHVILGFLGVITTLTAAYDFPHKYVKNAPGQSGTLSKIALVTQNEMLEHSFYQFLNLWQVLYLYSIQALSTQFTAAKTTIITSTSEIIFEVLLRFIALWIVTSPWLFRHFFPVHSFSNNWKQTPNEKRTSEEVILYQIKKTQYIFYKHVILHGINISLAIDSTIDSIKSSGSSSSSSSNLLTSRVSWRIFWLTLYTSYVMEFFLQTMVRRKVLSQTFMLWLQRLLMSTASVAAAISILGVVHPTVCIVSVILNFKNRYHDVFNVMMVYTLFTLLHIMYNSSS